MKIIPKYQKGGIPVTYYTQNEAIPLLANNPNRTAVLDEVTVKPYRKIPQQYNNGITNQTANEKADEYTNRTSPGIMDLFTIGTLGGMNNLSPTQWGRRVYDTFQFLNRNMTSDKLANNWFYGNNGIVSDEYAEKHPYLSAAANLVGDAATFGGAAFMRKLPAYRTINKIVEYGVNPADTSLGKQFAVDSGLYPDFSKMTRAEKIKWLKTNQELAQRVDQARTLDALHLTKNRLRNGGFDRLGKALIDDYSGASQNILGVAAGQRNNAKIVYDWIKNYRQEILKRNPTKGSALEVQKKEQWSSLNNENAGVGVLSRFYSWFKDAPRGLKGLQKSNKGAAHEFAHYTYVPFSFPKGFDPKAAGSVEIARYFTGGNRFPNTGEIAARGTQLKNYFGLKEGEQLTPEMWNYARRHYVSDIANNNMKDFFVSGSNKYSYHPSFLQWLNKHAPAIGAGITTGTLNYLNNE